MDKKFLTLGLVIVLGAALIFCCAKTSERVQTEKPPEMAATVQKVKLDIEGMTCSGCAFGVETALKRVAGVKQAEASFDEKSAEVEFDATVAKVDQMMEAVNKAGFTAKAPNLN